MSEWFQQHHSIRMHRDPLLAVARTRGHQRLSQRDPMMLDLKMEEGSHRRRNVDDHQELESQGHGLCPGPCRKELDLHPERPGSNFNPN